MFSFLHARIGVWIYLESGVPEIDLPECQDNAPSECLSGFGNCIVPYRFYPVVANLADILSPLPSAMNKESPYCLKVFRGVLILLCHGFAITKVFSHFSNKV